MAAPSHCRILIVDFGAQYTQLIARRLRELHVYCEIHPYDVGDDFIRAFAPRGIVLSGGPNSVTEGDTPRAPTSVWSQGVPVLGICYGMQTMAAQLGGTVEGGHVREFGYAEVRARDHSRLLRELQDRTGGFTEFVPLSFIPFHTLLGRTHGIEEIARDENLKHTAVFRLALGRTVRNLQASWVKMGLDAATESLRWGVNDLGGTLMEESISRMAGSQHGVKLEVEDFVGAARAAGRKPAQRDTVYNILETY